MIVALAAVLSVLLMLVIWIFMFPDATQRVTLRQDHPSACTWCSVSAVAAVVLAVVPSFLIFLHRQTVILEGFPDAALAEPESLIAHLLRGERLVPPAAPADVVFTTDEILRLRPEVVLADRRWERIDPELQQRVLAVFAVMRERYGYEMALVEGYRSPERQSELIKAGTVTRVGAWQSCHQYGLAGDSAPVRDGALQWDMADAWTRRGYQLYGELAQQAGLVWGGTWRALKDYVHVELADPCRQSRAARADRTQRTSGR